MVVQCNLFSRHASGWEQRSDGGCAPAFPTDDAESSTLTFYIKTNVDIAILTPAYTLATPVWAGAWISSFSFRSVARGRKSTP